MPFLNMYIYDIPILTLRRQKFVNLNDNIERRNPSTLDEHKARVCLFLNSK